MRTEDIKFNCPHCQQPVEAPSQIAGQEATCPHCRQAVVVPSRAIDSSVDGKPIINSRKTSGIFNLITRPVLYFTIYTPVSAILYVLIHASEFPFLSLFLYFPLLAVCVILQTIIPIKFSIEEVKGSWLRINYQYPAIESFFLGITRPIFYILYMILVVAVLFAENQAHLESGYFFKILNILICGLGHFSFIRLVALSINKVIGIKLQRRIQDYSEGRYISFKLLTATHRQGIIGLILCSVADFLMFPFFLIFHQFTIPNVFIPRWDKWRFLQITAIAFLVWSYFVQIFIFYGTGITVFVINFLGLEKLFPAIVYAIGSMFLASLVITFNLFLAKSFIEIISVFLKIEENTSNDALIRYPLN
jgi:hypothetical protein